MYFFIFNMKKILCMKFFNVVFELPAMVLKENMREKISQTE